MKLTNSWSLSLCTILGTDELVATAVVDDDDDDDDDDDEDDDDDNVDGKDDGNDKTEDEDGDVLTQLGSLDNSSTSSLSSCVIWGTYCLRSSINDIIGSGVISNVFTSSSPIAPT